LHQRLDDLYAIGSLPDGGTYRPLYSRAWAAAVERVEHWFKDAGLKTHHDAVGNLWGRAEGTEKGKSIVTGSHIDTVRQGGRLDGALGIVAGLTAVETLLKTKGKPRRTLEVVAICEEEGSGFNTNFWGSRAIVGAIDRVDAELAEAMRERGLDPGRVATAARDDIDTFVELHIEQGAVLESSGTPLAVVSAIVGTAQLAVTVTGRADHAGTTPMTMRHDALAGAAAMIQAIEGLARSHGAPAVATVGRIRAEPDQVNVIPGRAMFTVDVRHADYGARRGLEERVRSICETIAGERKLRLEIRVLQEKAPVAMHADVREVLWQAIADSAAKPWIW
jgi:allantoate deiminase